jgi:hypothetical protein
MRTIGYAPVKQDSAGNLYADTGTIVAGGDADIYGETDEDSIVETGRLGVRGARNARSLDRRIARLEGRRARRMGDQDEVVADAMPQDLRQAAAAAGMLAENQFNGLGSSNSVAAGASGSITDTINRHIWAKSLVLDALSDQANFLVTAITIAGLPFQIGSKGAPLKMFAQDSTRFGVSFGRRLALTGQTFAVTCTNVGAGADTFTGGLIVDELNPYAMQAFMEHMLLQAIVSKQFAAAG